MLDCSFINSAVIIKILTETEINILENVLLEFWLLIKTGIRG
jgi:hypothetical protein